MGKQNNINLKFDHLSFSLLSLTNILHHSFSGSCWVQQLQGREASLFDAVDYELLMSVAEAHGEREHHCLSPVSTKVTSIKLLFYYLFSCMTVAMQAQCDR